MRRVYLLAAFRCLVLAALTAPAAVGLSVIVHDMVEGDRAPEVLALITSAGAAAAMAANPLFGWLADLTRSPVGRRRPWLMGGALVGLLGALAMVWAPGVWWLAAAWVLTQTAYNACFGALNGWVSEGLAPELRRKAAGVFSAAAFVGILPGLALAAIFPGNITIMFLTLPVVAALVIGLVAVRIDDPARDIDVHSDPRARGLRRTVSREFAAVWLTRLVFAVPMSATLVFGLFMFTTRWDLPVNQAVRLTTLVTLTGAVGVVTSSISLTLMRREKSGEKRLLAIALPTLAFTIGGWAFAPTPLVFAALALVGGLAVGVGYTCTRALAHAILPHDESAFGLGILNVATTLAAVVAPLMAGGLLALGARLGLMDDYAGMLVLLAMLTLAATFVVAMVPASARTQVQPALSSRDQHQ